MALCASSSPIMPLNDLAEIEDFATHIGFLERR
jgi:hypothetical protein